MPDSRRWRHASHSCGRGAGHPDQAASARDTAERLIDAALDALALDDASTWSRCVERLSDVQDDPRIVDLALIRTLRGSVRTAWERGWLPSDLARHSARELTVRHRSLLVDAIADEMRTYSAATVDSRWRAQLEALSADVWWASDDDRLESWRAREDVSASVCVASVLELLRLLAVLPRLAMIGPPPGSAVRNEASRRRAASAAPDQRMLSKVRALLAKAESTEFPEEAEALSARAQELITKHSIDHALLAASEDGPTGPDGCRIPVDAPYESPKAVLLTVVAEANRCRAVWHRELGLSTVLGFSADLAATEMLFTSLLVQATSAMVRAGSHQDNLGRSRTRSFRHAFLNAYAARIGERLHAASTRATREAAANQNLLPVLSAREEAVDQAVSDLFPALTRGRTRRVTNYEGWVAGRAAADLAALHANDQISTPS
ncbi:DUF2786 domain-containing protein [Actinomadura rupiterrae]|uniref:DUF2786 domain-containing protein n=1 Tax=Actinomadura rupiterrae TaxID=559627 RepID=UPI0020A3968C|nr:DUF2786 domain-containing protein [Actinomadura rupiterrae]MCP2340959.1 hypothetical protein [Actinomadura rupiterrae]